MWLQWELLDVLHSGPSPCKAANGIMLEVAQTGRGGGSALGKGDAEFMEGERRKNRGQGTGPLIFRFLV